MTSSIRRWALLPAAVTVALVVGACGGDDDDAGNADDEAGDGSSDADEEDSTGGADDSGGETFEDDAYPFTFEYPSEFRVSEDVSFSVEAGGNLEDNRAVALNEEDMLILSRTALNIAIDESNIGLAKDEMDRLYQQIDPDSEPGQTGEYGGFVALEYRVSVDTPEDGESRIVSLFEGDQQYTINCQSTPDHREEIESACQQALDTLSQE